MYSTLAQETVALQTLANTTATRVTIVIDGSFKLTAAPASPCLMGASCSIIFLSQEHNGDKLKVKMLDAMHFDVENVSNPTPFHPIFHAQRDTARTTAQECRDVLDKTTHVGVENIEIEMFSEERVRSNPYFRLPTPQLDLFAVVTIVAADYFSNPGDTGKDSYTVDLFQKVLKLLADEKNIVRQGHAAECLNKRFNDAKNICAANWYPEIAN